MIALDRHVTIVTETRRLRCTATLPQVRVGADVKEICGSVAGKWWDSSDAALFEPITR